MAFPFVIGHQKNSVYFILFFGVEKNEADSTSSKSMHLLEQIDSDKATNQRVAKMAGRQSC
jgi:hypothetical protein